MVLANFLTSSLSSRAAPPILITSFIAALLSRRRYAAVLAAALKQGRRVSEHVQFYIQFGSQETREYSRRQGYIDIFERAGARLIEPSCGACINAGPGVSTRPDQVVISAQNRNFP